MKEVACNGVLCVWLWLSVELVLCLNVVWSYVELLTLTVAMVAVEVECSLVSGVETVVVKKFMVWCR